MKANSFTLSTSTITCIRSLTQVSGWVAVVINAVRTRAPAVVPSLSSKSSKLWPLPFSFAAAILKLPVRTNVRLDRVTIFPSEGRVGKLHKIFKNSISVFVIVFNSTCVKILSRKLALPFDINIKVQCFGSYHHYYISPHPTQAMTPSTTQYKR